MNTGKTAVSEYLDSVGVLSGNQETMLDVIIM